MDYSKSKSHFTLKDRKPACHLHNEHISLAMIYGFCLLQTLTACLAHLGCGMENGLGKESPEGFTSTKKKKNGQEESIEQEGV